MIKPPIPNLIAHTAEPKSARGLIIGLVIITVIIAGVFIYRSYYKPNDK